MLLRLTIQYKSYINYKCKLYTSLTYNNLLESDSQSIIYRAQWQLNDI